MITTVLKTRIINRAIQDVFRTFEMSQRNNSLETFYLRKYAISRSQFSASERFVLSTINVAVTAAARILR